LLRPTSPISAIASPELQPIVKDLRGLIKDLESDRRTRDDDQGVLILSQFTGAARELPEALIVNPYNIDQCAAALHIALEMPRGEQISRMRSMRGLIQEFNVYRWAGRMLLDAASLRQRTRLFDRIEANRVRNFRVAP
jgi:hypothetical protein